MAQSAETIAEGARAINNGTAMRKMVYDPETGDFTMVEVIEEGVPVDEFSKDGFACKRKWLQ